MHQKKVIDELSAELDSLKSKFENADFHFRKFDCSSERVEKMISSKLKFRENKGAGIGFVEIAPPYNHNYTRLPLSDEEIENEKNMEYGKGLVVEPTKSVPIKITEPKGLVIEPVKSVPIKIAEP